MTASYLCLNFENISFKINNCDSYNCARFACDSSLHVIIAMCIN